jgi:hypothetical protein
VGLPLADQVPDRRVATITSVATTRHPAVRVLASVWQTTPCRALASCTRHLLLLVGREDVDHPVDGLGGVLGVQVAKTRWPVSAA